jgi:hypothetical protein
VAKDGALDPDCYIMRNLEECLATARAYIIPLDIMQFSKLSAGPSSSALAHRGLWLDTLDGSSQHNNQGE